MKGGVGRTISRYYTHKVITRGTKGEAALSLVFYLSLLFGAYRAGVGDASTPRGEALRVMACAGDGALTDALHLQAAPHCGGTVVRAKSVRTRTETVLSPVGSIDAS